MSERLSWAEIKGKYPHRYVGLTDIEYGINKASVLSAVVTYTDQKRSLDDLMELYLKGDILLRYTTLDEDEANIG